MNKKTLNTNQSINQSINQPKFHRNFINVHGVDDRIFSPAVEISTTLY
jgi:hypothetical protein